jgi:hypothetical protein
VKQVIADETLDSFTLQVATRFANAISGRGPREQKGGSREFKLPMVIVAGTTASLRNHPHFLTMNSFAYPCAPIPEVPESHYSRLCPYPSGEWAPHDEGQLHDLSELMKKEGSPDAPIPLEHVMRSGYVYLGQFIDHDITRDLRSLDEAGSDVEHTLNYRTPRLDLDVLYGKDPSTVPCLYTGDGYLRLGLTKAVGSVDGSENDLPRQSDGTAIIIDPRNDENLVVAQLHVLFAKFHNRIVDFLKTRPQDSVGPSGTTLFQQARRFVIWHYQYVVLKDFLPHVVRTETLTDIKEHGLHLFPRSYTPADSPIPLPVEFTMAAFRFGHSMVRNEYLLNKWHPVVPLEELIKMTKAGGEIPDQLPADYVISWKKFFTGGTHVNRGESIDTFISPALYELPKRSVLAFRHQIVEKSSRRRLYQNQAPTALPEVTLRRGSRVRLPSGEEFARRFGYKPLDPEQIPAREEDRKFFQQDGLCGRTPLWYYLLREAAVEAVLEREPEGRRTIQKLGTIGGRIVAEVIHQLLNADYNSIMHAGKCWQPRQFTTMQEIVQFVDDT